MNLYEIDAAITALVDPETGEVSDFDAFDQLSMARDQKIENIALYYKNLVADAAAYKAEKLAFAERQKAAENKAQRLKDYLAYALQGQKFESPRCAVNFRKTISVNVADPDTVLAWLQDHGSSTYDTAQMSRLIDLIVQDCREQGIETLPPDKLAGMMEEWGCTK